MPEFAAGAGRDRPQWSITPRCQMLNTAFSLFLAAAAGVSIVVQQALNANLRAAIGSAAWSGFSSYLVGLVCMA
jgi:hypothetical protein